MTLDQKMAAATTVTWKSVLPNTTNHYDTLFGGQALEWMDELAFIVATRFCRQTVVTVSLDRTDFKIPIPAGTLVEMVGSIIKIGNTSLQVRVEMFVEDMYSEKRESAIHGTFTLVAVDENRKPTPVFR
jgi:acyl-CoA hydrolase